MSQYELVMSNQAEWTSYEGVDVLRIRDDEMVAVPATGRKNSSRFVVINVNTKEEICYLLKKEVYGWMCKQYLAKHDLIAD